MKHFIKHNYKNHKETIHNFIWRSLQLFGKQGITFLIFLLCAKLLTPYDFGIYNYIISIIFLLITIGDFGVSTAIAKYVAEYALTDKQKLKAILFNSLIIILSLEFVLIILTIFFGEYLLKENYVYIFYMLPMIFLAPISSVYDGIFRGLKRFKELAIFSLSIGVISMFFIYYFIETYGLVGALISQSIFYFILVSVYFFVYGNLYIKFDKKLIKTIFSYALLIGVANLGYFFYTRVDLIMLGYYGYTLETGYYGLISVIFNLCLILFSIMGTVIAPNNIALQVKGKIYELKKKLKFYSKYSLLVGILLSIFLLFFVPLALNLFLQQYAVYEFFKIFYIFLFIIPLSVLEATIATGFITPLGYVKILVKAIIIGGIMNIILNFVFLYYFGFLGIIISTVIVHNLINISKIYIFYKKFNK